MVGMQACCHEENRFTTRRLRPQVIESRRNVDRPQRSMRRELQNRPVVAPRRCRTVGQLLERVPESRTLARARKPRQPIQPAHVQTLAPQLPASGALDPGAFDPAREPTAVESARGGCGTIDRRRASNAGDLAVSSEPHADLADSSQRRRRFWCLRLRGVFRSAHRRGSRRPEWTWGRADDCGCGRRHRPRPASGC